MSIDPIPAHVTQQKLIPHARRNFKLGVFSGTVGNVANDFIDPEIILAGLVFATTGSVWLVAIVSIINKASALAPQLLAGSMLEHKNHKMRYFVLATLTRAVGLAGLVMGMYHLTLGVTPWSLSLFMASFLVSNVSAGVAWIVFMDMTGRMIPAGRLGSFFGMRSMTGQILAVFAGAFVIQPILGHGGDLAYLLLGIAGGVLCIASMVLIWFCRDDHETPYAASRPSTITDSLKRGFSWVRQDRNYRLFFLQKVAFRFEYLGLAFFIPYGREILSQRSGTEIAVLGGVMVAVMKSSRIVASWVLGKVADRGDHRFCLIVSGMGFAVAPASALLAPHLPELFNLAVPTTTLYLNLPMAVYLLALGFLGFASEGLGIGGDHFIVTCAPTDRRISYAAFANTVTSPLTLLPLAAAWIAESIGIHMVFVISLCGGIASTIFAMRMDCGRVPVTGSIRNGLVIDSSAPASPPA
jgi:MFS family permease